MSWQSFVTWGEVQCIRESENIEKVYVRKERLHHENRIVLFRGRII